MRPFGAYSFFVYSKQACGRASYKCMGRVMRPFSCTGWSGDDSCAERGGRENGEVDVGHSNGNGIVLVICRF